MDIDFTRLISEVRDIFGLHFTAKLLESYNKPGKIKKGLALYYDRFYASKYSNSDIINAKNGLEDKIDILTVDYAIDNYKLWLSTKKGRKMKRNNRNVLKKTTDKSKIIVFPKEILANPIGEFRPVIERALKIIWIEGSQLPIYTALLEKNIPHFPLSAILDFIKKNPTYGDINKIIAIYLAFHLNYRKGKKVNHIEIYSGILRAFFESSILESRFNLGVIKDNVHQYQYLIWKTPLPEPLVKPDNLEVVSIPWITVTFLHKKIEIINPQYPELKPLIKDYPESRVAYKSIKRIFERFLPPLKAFALEGRLVTLLNDTMLSECVLALTGINSEAFESLKLENKQLKRNQPKLFEDYESIRHYLKQKDSEYYQYLCDFQLNKQIYWCFENHGNTIIDPNNPSNETGFIFTIKQDERQILLMYENDSPGRSSILFFR